MSEHGDNHVLFPFNPFHFRYYFRVGVESVIKGLDIAVLNMRVGDKW
jgi:FKBP-type peptidyl-prolyl cis-trans isomerase 2